VTEISFATEILIISMSRLANKNIVHKQQKGIFSVTCGFAHFSPSHAVVLINCNF
jgi:hypothetical protein